MKRDFELVHRIAVAIEGREGPCEMSELGLPAEYTERMVAYHLYLMANAGLISGHSIGVLGREDWSSLSLTWSGHDLLDKVREIAIEDAPESEYLHPLE